MSESNGRRALLAPGAAAVLPAGVQAALRAIQADVPARLAFERFAPDLVPPGTSVRGVVSRLRSELVQCARARLRNDLIRTFEAIGVDPGVSSRRLQAALDDLARTPAATPTIDDSLEHWLEARTVAALRRQRIRTFGELTLKVPRLKRWWRAVPGLGERAARRVEAFFAAHPSLTAQARALVCAEQSELIPWERLTVPSALDGSRGAYRAPVRSCVLAARNDYAAVQAWIELQESPSTRRAYRKEAERLILWAIVECGKPLSSLSTEDAIAYRSFLRQPRPAKRWVGPVAPRSSPQWRPFQGPLSARSAAYALSVVGALFRWLCEQRYLVANAFAGVRVKASRADAQTPGGRAFSEADWALVRRHATRLEDAGWSAASAQRLRFILDFAYATGLRNGELVRAQMADVVRDDNGLRWIAVTGKGGKAGRVAVPPAASLALDRYLAARGLSVQEAAWPAHTPLLARIDIEDARFTSSRLWAICKTYFIEAADALAPVNRALADRLRHASPHWMRHTHATHALSRGASLTSVRDNLRHASIATTSIYLHTDERKRAAELAQAFNVTPS
jgi:site-specific recombinase XerD